MTTTAALIWARARRRAPALVALAATLVLGMCWVELWNQVVHGAPVWLAPPDLWGTYLAAVALVHGQLNGIYTPNTGLVAFPGIAYLLAPIAAFGSALHLQIGPDYTAFAQPSAWPAVGPYELLLASVPLFAFDATAERLGVDRPRRFVLALAGAAVLANVTVKWGHPEDAVSLGLAVYAALEAERGRWRRCGWLLGVAIAVQPFAVLAAPAILAPLDRIDRRRLAGLVVPLVVPTALVLLPPLVASWHATTHSLLDQPNYPYFNHPTPWTSLLPRLPGRFYAVAAGPGRLIAIAVAAVIGVAACRRGTRLEVTLAVVAVAFVLRVGGEAVLDSFYTWPVIGLAILLAARRGWPRLVANGALGLLATWLSNTHWSGVWPWWLAMVGTLVVMVAIGWPAPAPDAVTEQSPEPGVDRPVLVSPQDAAAR